MNKTPIPPKSEDIEMLLRLKEDANSVIENLNQDAYHEAINWHDLSVWNTEKVLDSYGDLCFRVYVEEASPDAGDLQEAIRAELTERGWKDVEVRTEW